MTVTVTLETRNLSPDGDPVLVPAPLWASCDFAHLESHAAQKGVCGPDSCLCDQAKAAREAAVAATAAWAEAHRETTIPVVDAPSMVPTAHSLTASWSVANQLQVTLWVGGKWMTMRVPEAGQQVLRDALGTR
jgi:hypothetical protein